MFTSYQKQEIWNESMNQNKWCSSNKTWDSWQQDVDKNTLMLRCNEKKKSVKKNTNEQGNDIGKKDDPQNGACATSGNPCRQN